MLKNLWTAQSGTHCTNNLGSMGDGGGGEVLVTMATPHSLQLHQSGRGNFGHNRDVTHFLYLLTGLEYKMT